MRFTSALLAFVATQYGCQKRTEPNNGLGGNNYRNPLSPVSPVLPSGVPAQIPGERPAVTPVHIPLLPRVRDSCNGNNLGLYSWGYEVWNNRQSPMIEFLNNPRVQEFGCGDVYINAADYSAPNYIRDEYALVPFIRNVRANGNQAVVFLVYGDVQVSSNGAPNGPTEFADTVFDWLSRVSDAELAAMVPIGISYDCEHLPVSTIQSALTRAQQLKTQLINTRLGGDASKFVVEWTIEGERKPDDTDMVMRLADRALMMDYRNHVNTSPNDPTGEDNFITRLFDFMLNPVRGEGQCEKCLDDAYASANYKAKIKLMIEADCECGQSCKKISFCAFDARQQTWGQMNHLGARAYSNGAEYLTGTLREVHTQIRNHPLMTSERFARLFGDNDDLELFVVHNWQWFTCFFNDPNVAVSTPIGAKGETCRNHATLAAECRTK